MQKILSLSEHEVSEPENSNSKFLYGLEFLLNKFMAKRHPKSASIYPKMVTARPSNSSFLHLETTCLLICFRISSSFTSQRTLALDSPPPTTPANYLKPPTQPPEPPPPPFLNQSLSLNNHHEKKRAP